jgi:hypothetical protein
MLNYALFSRNAKACENAKHPKCTCVCGGALHGVSHAAKLQELWDAYVEREKKKADETKAD